MISEILCNCLEVIEASIEPLSWATLDSITLKNQMTLWMTLMAVYDGIWVIQLELLTSASFTSNREANRCWSDGSFCW